MRAAAVRTTTCEIGTCLMTFVSKRYSNQFRRYLWILPIILLASSFANAQSSTNTAMTPGTPAGSYKLGDADAVNLFTGSELDLTGLRSVVFSQYFNSSDS